MNPETAFRKFERRAPSYQTAIDIFSGKWACDISELSPAVTGGDARLFTADARPRMLADRFGRNGRLDDMSVLELGPLEGAHTYQLEKLGAKSIVAIEANAEAFLKCLIIKEILELRIAKFMLGDFLEYLTNTRDVYDVVMCSGVLYHMEDPIRLIRAIANITQKCFVWTHYFDQEHYPGPARELKFDPRYPGIKMYTLAYEDMEYERFWGGNRPIAVWLDRDDIVKAFTDAGFTSVEILEDSPNHPNGACFTFAATRG
jgi:SAM-dependent methyltransferase